MSSMIGQGGMAGPSGRVGNKLPSGKKIGQMQQFTPEQMNLFQQMFGQVSPESYTSRLAGGDQSLFDEMEAPAMRQFSGLQGNIASRFSGQGMGARRSSGFQNTMNQSSSDFAQDLQSRRQGLQRQAIQDLMGMSNSLLGQRPYEQFTYDKAPSKFQSFMGGALPIAGGVVGGVFGGPAGAYAGSQLGSAAGNAFSGKPSTGMNFSGMSGLSNSWGSSPQPQADYSQLKLMAQGLRG